MKNNNIIRQLLALAAIFFASSCISDLDRYPINGNSAEKVYSTFEGYKSVLAKVYNAYGTSVNEGPAGYYDTSVGAEGDFLRAFFNLQSLTSEEGITTWSDAGLHDLNFMTWSPSNPFLAGLYSRSLYQILLVNEFLRESTDEKLNSRGISAANAEEIKFFRAEVRFLRAFQYWVLMDIFGNPSFIDENSLVGQQLPPQIKRADLFNYIENELLEIQTLLKDARSNEYGRADKAACWALLARLYLNAEIYTGTAHYSDAITYSSKVIAAGYSLKDSYAELFLADNHLNNPEVILSINYDGLSNQSYGGLCYIINAGFIVEHDEVPSINFREYFGMGGNGGWFGNRARKELTDRFEPADSRRLFFGQKASVDDVGEFTDGLMVAKFRNVTSNGSFGSNYEEAFPDTDFPLFRLAEMNFIYAEAVLRGGTGGTMANALIYMNDLRRRAFGNTSHDFVTFSLDDILNERSRELYWEGFRRTDLIRFGKYTSDTHLWQWKGGIKAGKGVENHRNLFPIPASDRMANPNLKQNEGYETN
ncbi:MAG: RagB/SusD family nutrient uptake outer membrane protein [Prevotellaceae bacterium]|jgi:hypothetical protein|nr:RagB/SusD family nutrient uptake outer membrane protein [Prevotellaceae bacterium]